MNYKLDVFTTDNSCKILRVPVLFVDNKRVNLKSINISWETQNENIDSGKYLITAQGYYAGTDTLRQFDIDAKEDTVEVKEINNESI